MRAWGSWKWDTNESMPRVAAKLSRNEELAAKEEAEEVTEAKIGLAGLVSRFLDVHVRRCRDGRIGDAALPFYNSG